MRRFIWCQILHAIRMKNYLNNHEEDNALQGQFKDEIYLFEYHIIFFVLNIQKLKMNDLNDSHIMID